MAKSPSELVAELATLTDGLRITREEVKLLVGKIERLERAHATTREQFAAEAAKSEEFRKRYDESDRRRFTLVGLIIGAILSLAVQAFVTYALRK